MSTLDSSPTADGNLLFGILALQMDFISREALITAMQAWVLQKSKPLGQLLVEQGALAAEHRGLLEPLVQKHVEMHSNDPQKSLAAVTTAGSARQQLEQIADADLHQSLALIASHHTIEDYALATQPPTVGESTSAGQRFRILRPHAEGGLGKVFVAHDEELCREVALKEIKDRYADDPDKRSRFLLEAEITGGLEHPSIVPVYGLGQYADGRPFYAMRFIRGDSLQDAIARFHGADAPSRDAGERTLELRKLLGRFLDVCNAITYAHARGVLHRDLKPGNIMLGKYGETLVVDWGLAKPLGHAEKTTTSLEGPLQPSSAGGSAATQMGSAIGTPAYMPPEQAVGRLDQLGPASDVYSLGATLYCLLTGVAPFEGRDIGALLRNVQQGEFRPPRQVSSTVPAPLEAVCLKAMALKPEDRYASPSAMAADIERWLADEPVSAWREPWRLRARRWARRHRTLVASAASALVIAAIAAVVGAWRLDREQDELRHGVESALVEVADLQARGHWDEARAVLKQAKDRLGDGGSPYLRERVEQVQADLKLVASLDAIRLEWSTLIEGTYDRARADRDYGKVFQDAGIGEVGSDAAVAASRISSSAVRDAIVAALDDWLGCGRTKARRLWIRDLLRRVDPDPWRDAVRDPSARSDGAVLAKLAIRPGAAEQSPQLLCAVAERLLTLKRDAEPVLRLAYKRYPDDFWVNLILANVLREKGRLMESVGYHRAAVSLRPGIAVAHLNLSAGLNRLGRWDESIIESQKASELDPRDALAPLNLAIALRETGRFNEAIAELHKAIRLREKFAPLYYHLGKTFYQEGDFAQAIIQGRKAIELDPKYALAHAWLGLALEAKGQQAEAAGEYQKAVELDPKDSDFYYNLARALQKQGDLDKAIAHFQRAIELAPGRASAHYNLGLALKKKGRLDEALGEYYKASALNPTDAYACEEIGYVLGRKARSKEAIAEYRKAIKLNPHYALAYNNLGSELRDAGQVDEAIAELNKAIECNPRYALAYYGLGLCYEDTDELDRAVPMFRKSIELDPKLARSHRMFAYVLKRQGNLEEAITQFQQALKLEPNNAVGQEQLARCRRMLALDKKSPSILKGDIQLIKPSEQLDFAELCLWRHRPVAAVRFYKSAFAATPQLAEDGKAYRYQAIVAAAFAAAGQGEDAQNLDEQERRSYHRQAIRWLREHFAMRAKQIEHGTLQEKLAAQKMLRYWRRRADFAILYDPAVLEGLSAPDLAVCRKLWDDVATVLKK